MAEFNFNSESSYSKTGERSSSAPITVSFKNDAPTPAPQPPKKKGKVLKTLAAGILVVGVSLGSGALGAYLVRDNGTAPVENVPQTTAVLPSVLGSQIASADVSSSASKGTYTAVAEKAKPTVVEITTEIVSNNSYFQQYVESGAGSGVIISTDGYIITNSKFGKSVAVVVDEETFVSLPARCVEDFENMTDEQLEGCLAGKMKLANFETRDAKQGRTITFTYEEV